MDQADVVILGAGVAGCSVAAHLVALQPGIRVLLADQHHVGAGSTSRSTAAFRHQWSVPAHVAFSRYASGEYDRLAAAGYPIQFRRNGYLFLYTDAELLARAAARVEAQRALGVEGVEVLTASEFARVPGGEHLDDPQLLGATWGRRDGFLDPLAVAQAYLDEARAGGVVYRPGWEAVRVVRSQGKVTGVHFADATTVATPTVINCGGVWSHSVAQRAGLSLPTRPAKRYLYHTHPVRAFDVSRWPLIIADSGAHCRPSEGNTLMLAWERLPESHDHPGPQTLWDDQDRIDSGFTTHAADYGLEVLTELARHLSSFAESVALARVTCGWYTVTPDHKAILGEDPRLTGFFHATGFSGHGIMHGAATGRVLAERVLQRPPTLASAAELEANFGLATLLDGRVREPVEDMVL